MILRHAKSDWSSEGADHERPLARRGQVDAPRVGDWLNTIGSAPDRVVCSTAERTRETLELASRAGQWSADVHFEAKLYGAGVSTIAAIVRALPASVQRPLIVSHQPGSGDFVGRAIGGGHVRFPTAALAALRPPGPHWNDWQWGDWQLEWLMTPKGLP